MWPCSTGSATRCSSPSWGCRDRVEDVRRRCRRARVRGALLSYNSLKPSAVESGDVVEAQDVFPEPGSSYGHWNHLHDACQSFAKSLSIHRRQRRRSVRADSEESAELRMELVEDHRRITGLLLTRHETAKIRRVIVQNSGLPTVKQAQALFLQSVGDLYIFPCRIGKSQVEGIFEQRLARQTEIRRIEEIERHVVRVFDQRVAELQSILVDIAQKGVQTHARMPRRIADHRQQRMVREGARGFGVHPKPSTLRDGVVTEEGHSITVSQLHAPIAGAFSGRTADSCTLGASQHCPSAGWRRHARWDTVLRDGVRGRDTDQHIL